MKSLILVAALALTGCVAPGYNAQNDTETFQTFSTTYHGVRSVPGNGLGYFKDTARARELSKEERDYIAANKVDFAATQRANEEANKAQNERELRQLKAETPKISCEEFVAMMYDVANSRAWAFGEWETVQNFDSQKYIRQCKANQSR